MAPMSYAAAVRSTKWQPNLRPEGTPPWRSKKAWGADVESEKAAESEGVISRDEFLAGRLLSLLKPDAQTPGSYWLRTESSAVVSPLLRPAPPPGLEHLGPLPEMPLEKSEDAPVQEKPKKQPVVDSSPPEPKEYKVFLQNVPEAMLKECMLRVMLEQAHLKDIKSLAFRSNGKVLITFASYASVHVCINHFNGRQWGSSLPIVANYVYIAKNNDGVAASNEATNRPMAAPPALAPPMAVSTKTFNLKAPTFVPGAAAFVPTSDKMEDGKTRDRIISDASTDVGPDGVSDGFESETECSRQSSAQALCT